MAGEDVWGRLAVGSGIGRIKMQKSRQFSRPAVSGCSLRLLYSPATVFSRANVGVFCRGTSG